MPWRVLLLSVLCCLASVPGLAGPMLHPRASLDGPRIEPDGAELRWLWQHRELRLGVIDHDNPPFDILGTGQAYEGITADYAGLLGEQLRLPVAVQVFATFDEAVAALHEGSIDVLGSVTARQARQAGLHLSRGYAVDRPLLLASQESLSPPPGQALRLVMVEGYRSPAQVLAAYPQAQVQRHPSPMGALAALVLGQADLYLGNALGSRYVLGRSQLEGIEEVGLASLPEQPLGFAMRANDGPLARLVDAALGNLSERQHARIRERWNPLAAGVRKPPPVQLSEAEQRWLRDNPSVSVLVDDQLLPLSYRDAKAELRGLSLDVLQLITRRTGLRFEIKDGGTLERMIAQVRQGKAQLIAGVPYSPTRDQQLAFSRAYLSAVRVLVTRDEVAAPVSLAQLEGQVLALVDGSALLEVLGQRYPGVRQLVVPGPLQALHAVADGQALAAVLTYDSARPLIARRYSGQLKINASLALPPVHFALASARDASELQSILNKALFSLSPQETDTLVRRWRSAMIVTDRIWPRYRSQVLLGFAVAFALLFVALLWIRYLRRLQVRLRRAMHETDTANQAKTRFLTTMSHELRTPLHSLLGMLELAQRKAEQGVLDRLAIEVATEAAGGLLELIGDILDIARIESGQLHLALQPVCLCEQVAGVVQLFEQQARSKGLALHLDTQGPVDERVMLDPVRFKQILTNLLSNAIKFTQQGQVRVNLVAQRDGEHLAVRLEVEDSGIGIAAAELAQLGQPFCQASNQHQSPRSSTGLGLGISRSLCELMGGGLRLHSVLGQGTQVQVQLKLALGTAPVSAGEPSAALAQPGEVRLRVLVVDDYPANRLLLAQQLDYLGHQARVAEDGSQALRLWLKEHFDVVISDCNMPRMNGYALARAIREHERRSGRIACRLIGLTASALPSERLRCRAAGMDDCLFKPLGLDELLRALASGAASHPQAPVLDLGHLERIVGKDQHALKALLADLRDSNQHDMQRLAAAGDDPATLAELAHRIKGGARIARAGALVALCERLECHCATRPVAIPGLRESVHALRAGMLRLEQALQRQAHIMPSNNNTSSITNTTPTMPDGP